MNFLLQNLELHCEEHALLRGERLLAENGLLNLYEVEKYLWVASVRDGRDYEVEVKISPSKVKAATCECQQFQDKKMCGHFVAVLLALRKELSSEKEKKEQKRRKPPGRLNVPIVLNQINSGELKAFVREYARHNRGFALTLLTRFSHLVAHVDSAVKYPQLLDSAISLSRRSDRSIAKTGVKTIAKVLEELYLQLEDCIAIEQYAEAAIICRSVFEKTAPVLTKVLDGKAILYKLIEKFFFEFEKLVKLPIAPDLKLEIGEYCLLECQRYAYRNNGFDLHFFNIINGLADEPEKVDKALVLFDDLRRVYVKEEREAVALDLAELDLLEQAGRKKALKDFVKARFSHPKALLVAIKNARAKGDKKIAKMLSVYGIECNFSERARDELEGFLLQFAEAENDNKSIQRLARSRFLATQDFFFYKKLKEVSGKGWKLSFNKLLDEIRANPAFAQKSHWIARILLEEQRLDELADYIEEQQSLELLMQFDSALLPELKKTVEVLYERFLMTFLKNHVGRQAAFRVKSVILHLQKLGYRTLADLLIKKCLKSFPERKSLQEELYLF